MKTYNDMTTKEKQAWFIQFERAVRDKFKMEQEVDYITNNFLPWDWETKNEECAHAPDYLLRMMDAILAELKEEFNKKH